MSLICSWADNFPIVRVKAWGVKLVSDSFNFVDKDVRKFICEVNSIVVLR